MGDGNRDSSASSVQRHRHVCHALKVHDAVAGAADAFNLAARSASDAALVGRPSDGLVLVDKARLSYRVTLSADTVPPPGRAVAIWKRRVDDKAGVTSVGFRDEVNESHVDCDTDFDVGLLWDLG